MIVRINGRYTVINGWLVDKQGKKLVRPSSRNLRDLSSEHRSKILAQKLCDWDTLFSSDGLIVPSADAVLFSHLRLEKFEFAEKEDKTVVLKTSYLMERNPACVKRSFTIACHKVCIRAKIYKYLQLVAEERQIDMLGQSLDLRLDRDNSVLAKDIKVREFVFSEADHEILCEYRELKTIYVFFGQKYLNYVYIRAESAASNHLNLDMKDGITSMVKKFSPNTINQYGVRLGEVLFILFNAWRLSAFKEHSFLPKESIDALLNDMENTDNIHAKMKILGECFCNCIRDDKHREYLVRWVRMCAFNIQEWDSFSLSCPENTVDTVRRLLDAIRCLVTFSCFAYTDDVQEVGEWFTSGSSLSLQNFWGWFRALYSKVLRQEGVEAASRVNVDFDRQTVRIDGRLVSFEYVREMKRDLARDFQAQMALLGEWLEFGLVADVYTTVMANKGIKVVDNISGRGSVFNVLDASSVAGYCMRFRDPEDATNEHKRRRILKIINSITKLLMLAVWVNPGLALRFPELSILSFGGSQRNLYFDSDDRVFIIRSRYNKNTKYDTRLLFLDKSVSAQLFWFIYILRPFTISLLGGRIARINMSAIMGALTHQAPAEAAQSVEEEAEDINFDAALYLHQQELKGRLANASAVEMGSAILKSMVFVDVQKMNIVQRATFSNLLLKYPADKPMRESHKIRSLRQGLAALWRHFIASPIAEQNKVVSQEIARGFGHSVAVDAAAYGFDSARSVGPGEAPFALAKKLCRVFQALTSPQGTAPSCVAAGELDVKGDGSRGDIFDLLEAGRNVIGEFEFRSQAQERFTAMVLMGDRHVLALQAPTAFGKTMTYLLQMLVLKRTRNSRYVHFIAVPYTSLKIATIERLNEAGLAAQDIALLKSGDCKSKIRDVDVVVGTFCSFGSQWLYSVVSGWEEELGAVKQKGYFVVDEAHVLWLEQDFREQLRQLHSLKWKEFLKVILLSATFPYWLFDEVCKQLNFSEFAIKNARWVNCVATVPNQAILKEVTSTTSKDFETLIESRVSSYLSSTVRGKAIFFFSDKARMRRCYEHWKGVPEVAAVDGDTISYGRVFPGFTRKNVFFAVVILLWDVTIAVVPT